MTDPTMSTEMHSESGPPDAVAELEAARDRLERARAELEADDLEEADLDAVADAYEAVERVLDRWEERATDWDDFEGYVEFRNDLSDTLESIPEDVPESDAFVEADGHVRTSGPTESLTERDFEAAREALAPAREYADRRSELSAARREYRDAVRTARDRRRELADRIDDLERLVRLGEADLEAPVAELREPIATYGEAVREAFAEFRREAPARELLGFVETAAATPMVDYRRPPADLLTYVREHDAGRHSVGELLTYAEFSTSKLEHYVEDPDLLKRRVATNRTYLERLSADPLTVAWPPAAADVLRFRTSELVSLVGRFADEETVAALRRVRRATRREDYERLRTAAVARAELSDEERRRVADGAVEEELQAARETLERLDAALEEHAPESGAV